MNGVILEHLIFALVLTISICGCSKELNSDANFTFENDKIICDHVPLDKIEADGDYILLSSVEDLYIFKHLEESFSLIQKIDFKQGSMIQSMQVHNGTLALYILDPSGIGMVLIYKRNNDLWELIQEIQYGNRWGSVDFTDTLMVTGVYEPTSQYGGTVYSIGDTGRIYIYRMNGLEWFQEAEFITEDCYPGDQFGKCVAIYNNLVLAGSSFHVYERNGLWQLLFLEDTVGATSIVHDGANFVIRNEYLDPGIWSCSLEPNGNLSFKSMDLDLKGYKISYNGEEVEIKDDLALVAVDYSYKCFLMKFENNKWNNIRQFGPESGESCSFDVLEITDQFLILGGYSDYSERSIIYFINR